MNCVSVNIRRIDRVTTSVKREGSISSQVSRVEKMEVAVFMVCDTGRYMIVTPSYVWLTDWDNELVDVKSNTNWNIE